MKRKLLKSFSLITAVDQNWDIGYTETTSYDTYIEYKEIHSPNIKCTLTPMPAIYRYSERRTLEKEEHYFLTTERMKLAGEEKD